MGCVKGWLCLFRQNRWQKNSGFEYENLCRKCLLSVEHFVSSRKTTTKKAKCGVFVFISGNIYQFSKGGRDVSHPCSRYRYWVWGGCVSPSLCLRSLLAAVMLPGEGSAGVFGGEGPLGEVASCRAELWASATPWPG